MSGPCLPALALITGGSSGMGLALAKVLSAGGTELILLARGREALDKAARECAALAPQGKRVHTLAVDLGHGESLSRGLAPLLEEMGTPDLVISGAGACRTDYFENLTDNDFEVMVNVNIRGHWNLMQALIPPMRAAGGGKVVFISSQAALMGWFGMTAYAATKFAIHGFAESLRNEVRPQGISVQIFMPADVDTPGFAEENRRKPYEGMVIAGNSTQVFTPEFAARQLLKRMRGRRFLIIPNAYGRLAAQILRLFPWLGRMIIDADVKKAQKKLAAGTVDVEALRDSGVV